MSYDVCCWRCQGELPAAPESLYERLRGEEEEVEGLDWISVAAIKARFQQAFPAMEDYGTELNLESRVANLQVGWPVGSKPQHTLAILVDCSWSLVEDSDGAEEMREELAQVVADLGCMLYDPQQSKLYEEPEYWSP
jgi:hypothetical protein